MSQHLFYRGWTRKEALIKATGEGLSADLRRIAVAVGDRARVLTCPDGDASAWKLHAIEPAAGYIGALATRWPVAPSVITHRDSLVDQRRRRAVA